MDKEDEAHIYNGILLIQKNEIMPFEATWMGLEVIMLKKVTEVGQRKTNINDITYMWNPKK